MKSTKINYVIVGAFVLLTIAGLIVTTALLTGRTGSADNYHAIYDNVTGVKYGSQVLYEGYPIGQVDDIVPVGQGARMRFRIDFSVQQGWLIPDDSLAKIAAPGLLSAVTISIESGRSATALKPGSEVKSAEAADILAAVTGIAAEIGAIAREDLKPVLANVNSITDTLAIMLERDGVDLVADITGLVKDVTERIPDIITDIESATKRIEQGADRFANLLNDDNRKSLNTVIGNAKSASDNFADLSRELKDTRARFDGLLVSLDDMVIDNKVDVEKSIVELRYVIDSISRHIDSTNHNLEATARNMYEFSRQIRQNPGLLLNAAPPADQAARR